MSRDRREYNREYRLAHHDVLLAKERERYKANGAERMRQWRAANPEKAQEAISRYRIAHRDEINAKRRGSRLAAERHRVRTYGLAAESYEGLLTNQQGVCAICRRPETLVRRGRTMPLVVDHDHTTGTVRGLLCDACNTGLGRFRDDPGLLGAALEYLRSVR